MLYIFKITLPDIKTIFGRMVGREASRRGVNGQENMRLWELFMIKLPFTIRREYLSKASGAANG